MAAGFFGHGRIVANPGVPRRGGSTARTPTTGSRLYHRGLRSATSFAAAVSPRASLFCWTGRAPVGPTARIAANRLLRPHRGRRMWMQLTFPSGRIAPSRIEPDPDARELRASPEPVASGSVARNVRLLGERSPDRKFRSRARDSAAFDPTRRSSTGAFHRPPEPAGRARSLTVLVRPDARIAANRHHRPRWASKDVGSQLTFPSGRIEPLDLVFEPNHRCAQLCASPRGCVDRGLGDARSCARGMKPAKRRPSGLQGHGVFVATLRACSAGRGPQRARSARWGGGHRPAGHVVRWFNLLAGQGDGRRTPRCAQRRLEWDL